MIVSVSRQKHIRGGKAGLTKAKAVRNPAAVILSYIDRDIQHERLLPDTHIAAIVGKLVQGQWTQLRYDCPLTGPIGECYATVCAAQQKLGGKIHTGWMTSQICRRGTNKLARVRVFAHAVLELNGELFETIPAYKGSRFLLDDAIPYSSQMGIDFLDSVQDAKRLHLVNLDVHLLTHIIDLALTHRELTAPDPDREARVIEVWQAWQETVAA